MTRVERWEHRAEIPLILLALAFLVAYAWPILNPNLDPSVLSVLTSVSWTVWAAFALDFLVRLVLAEARGHYVIHHWYDVALIALPLLRPLRLLRLLAFVRILDRSATNSLAGRTLVYAVGAALSAVGLGALAVLDAEQGAPHANITAFGDAVWWATTTVATVGYGDYVPVTLQGRCVAAVLMILGIGLVGTVTAAVASWLVARTTAEHANRIDPN